MKKIMTILLLLGLLACEAHHRPVPKVPDPEVSYFKDWETGLCFAKVASRTSDTYAVISIACVPCDSLKSLK